jgi:pentatricopeptide repeat protein
VHQGEVLPDPQQSVAACAVPMLYPQRVNGTLNVPMQCDACDLALDVFNQMHEDKIKPNVVTYNTLVDVYGKTGQWDKAVRVLADMREQVRTAQPQQQLMKHLLNCEQKCNGPGTVDEPGDARALLNRCCRCHACVLLKNISSVPNDCRVWNQKCALTTLPSLPATCVGSHKRLSRWAACCVWQMRGVEPDEGAGKIIGVCTTSSLVSAEVVAISSCP